MLWVPQKGVLCSGHNTGILGTATPGTAVTTGGAASTKGTAVELIASTTFDAYWITVIASDYALAVTDSQGCLDIMTGAATEEVIIPDLLIGACGSLGGTTAHGPKRWDFPLYIPAGSRISAKVAGARLTTAMRVSVFLSGGTGMPPFRVGSKVTTYGISTVPNGTTVVAGASGVQGAWTQISASSAEDHFCFVPSWQVGADTVWVAGTMAVMLGIGAATEEQIGPPMWYCKDTGETMEGPVNSFPIFQDVPAGTRLVMRATNSGVNDASYNGAIHAVS